MISSEWGSEWNSEGSRGWVGGWGGGRGGGEWRVGGADSLVRVTHFDLAILGQLLVLGPCEVTLKPVGLQHSGAERDNVGHVTVCRGVPAQAHVRLGRLV